MIIAVAGILIYAFTQIVIGGINNIQFECLTVNDGLSNSWVNAIIQDK
jgi:hypothetical protein